ncbi:alanine racemase [Ideonella sp. BN130291]|uniref:alanine racemase n=1 Tax=Ideonella sp. BN130291 TaxID=3112940 RepID=UPI002E253FF2|nr:alanine racemase [Ideonella sp. BN130291]
MGLTEQLREQAWYDQVRAGLRRAGVGEPAVVIDLDRLEVNAERLTQGVPAHARLRLVQKSLPSVPLLRQLAQRLGARGLMVFHRPFLNHCAVQAPEFDLLLGKPLPAAAAWSFYEHLPARGTFDPAQQLRWLVDTPERLAQYRDLARTLGIRLQVSVEIDVGLCRGGVADPQALAPVFALLAADPQHLRWAGFMGYDSHAVQAPRWTTPARAVAVANARYRRFQQWARERHPELWHDSLCFNGAGSGTLPLHGADTPLNDLSVGSALVKPTDFDVPTLQALQPAVLLATPVLKVLPRLDIPFVAALSRRVARWWPGRQQSVFLYGGRLMARPVWPSGLASNPLYGLSSNQQMMNLGAGVAIAPDDMVLWRPTQSEAVLLQHGAWFGMRQGQVVERFAVDPG